MIPIPMRRSKLKTSLPKLPQESPSDAPSSSYKTALSNGTIASVNHLCRDVRFRFYETHSLANIETKFLPSDIHYLSTSDYLILRILAQENNDVERASQWVAKIFSWRKQFGIQTLAFSEFDQETLSSDAIHLVENPDKNLLICHIPKLLEFTNRLGVVKTIRFVVCVFEKLFRRGAARNVSLVAYFDFLDLESWNKLIYRHLLNELICGCGYYRYPGFCQEIIFLDWEKDREGDLIYKTVLSKDWPPIVLSKISFARHDPQSRSHSSARSGGSPQPNATVANELARDLTSESNSEKLTISSKEEIKLKSGPIPIPKRRVQAEKFKLACSKTGGAQSFNRPSTTDDLKIPLILKSSAKKPSQHVSVPRIMEPCKKSEAVQGRANSAKAVIATSSVSRNTSNRASLEKSDVANSEIAEIKMQQSTPPKTPSISPAERTRGKGIKIPFAVCRQTRTSTSARWRTKAYAQSITSSSKASSISVPDRKQVYEDRPQSAKESVGSDRPESPRIVIECDRDEAVKGNGSHMSTERNLSQSSKSSSADESENEKQKVPSSNKKCKKARSNRSKPNPDGNQESKDHSHSSPVSSSIKEKLGNSECDSRTRVTMEKQAGDGAKESVLQNQKNEVREHSSTRKEAEDHLRNAPANHSSATTPNSVWWMKSPTESADVVTSILEKRTTQKLDKETITEAYYTSVRRIASSDSAESLNVRASLSYRRPVKEHQHIPSVVSSGLIFDLYHQHPSDYNSRKKRDNSPADGSIPLKLQRKKTHSKLLQKSPQFLNEPLKTVEGIPVENLLDNTDDSDSSLNRSSDLLIDSDNFEPDGELVYMPCNPSIPYSFLNSSGNSESQAFFSTTAKDNSTFSIHTHLGRSWKDTIFGQNIASVRYFSKTALQKILCFEQRFEEIIRLLTQRTFLIVCMICLQISLLAKDHKCIIAVIFGFWIIKSRIEFFGKWPRIPFIKSEPIKLEVNPRPSPEPGEIPPRDFLANWIMGGVVKDAQEYYSKISKKTEYGNSELQHDGIKAVNCAEEARKPIPSLVERIFSTIIRQQEPVTVCAK